MPFKYNPHIDELDFYGIAGPSGGSTDNAVARWDGTGGIALQDSSVLINDAGNIGVGATPTATEQLKIVNDQADDALGQLLIKGLATQTADELEIQHESGNPAARMVCAGTGGLIQACFDNVSASAASVALEATGGATINFGTHADRDAYGIVGAYNSVLNVESKTRDIILRSGTVTPIMQLEHDTGNVGVRVAAPTQMLQVGDGVIEPHTIYVKGPNSGTDYTCLHLERKYPQIQMTDTSGSIFYIWNLGNQMRFGGSAGSAENSTFYIDHGTGDETTMYMNCQLRLQGSGVTHGADYADFNVDGNGALTIDTVDSDGAVGHINLVPDGKVAIGGTTDYTRALNVLGGIQVRESDDGNMGVQIAPDADEGFIQIYYIGVEKIRFQGDGDCWMTGNGRKLGVGTTAPDKNLELNDASGGALRLTYNDNNGSATDYCDFQVGSNGDLTVTTVDSDGAAGHIALMSDGNVGIGIASPVTLLQVNGTAGVGIAQGISFGDGDCGFYEQNDDRLAFAGLQLDGSSTASFKLMNEISSATNPVFVSKWDASSGLGMSAAGIVHLITSSTTVLTVNGTDVGIGTSTPNNLLTIKKAASSVIFDIESDVNQLGVIYFSDTTQGRGQIRYNHTDDEMTFWTTAGQKAVIDSSGQVGIGIASPGYPLDVSGTIQCTGDLRLANSTYIRCAGNTHIKFDSAFTTFSTRTVFFDGIDVGMGTSTPDSQLTVYSAAASTTRISIHNDKAASAGMAVLQLKDIQTASSDDDWNIEHGRYDGMLSFYHGGTKMVIDDDGNVGIGKLVPTALLHCDQSSTTGAKPVVTVDQADVSEEFIRFIGTSADTVLTQTLVEAGDEAGSTLAGWLKIYVSDDGNQITDQAYYVPFYTLNA